MEQYLIIQICIAWEILLNRHRIKANVEYIRDKFTGLSTKEIIAQIVIGSTDKDQVSLSKEKEQIYLELLKNNMVIRLGLVDFIKRAKEMGILCAIATSSDFTTTERALEIADIKGLFDLVVTGDCVNESKPNPEIFLYVVDKLGVSKESSLVFEDSATGIHAAIKADIDVVLVGNFKTTSQRLNSLMRISSFNDPQLKTFLINQNQRTD